MFQFVSKVFTSFASFVTSVFNPSTATGGGVTPDSNTLLGYDTTTTTETVETITKDKKNLTPNGEIIIGIKSPTLLKRLSGIDTTTFDTTTYSDSAIIKLTNNSGSTKYLHGLSIRGKIVLQLSGQNGYVWEYSDYDAIEKEGEKYFEVSNDFIFDPVQAKQVGDFVWKELKPHKLYALALVGCHYEYEIGDVYHLTLEHTMNNGTMENIDTDVEVLGTSINRSVGGVGVTQLNLRVPSEAWSLTLAKNSKLVGAANSQRLNNRSNVVTIAASDWTGQADYFCDGTDDDVEIQAAIDYVCSLGGGTCILTSGQFNTSDTIYIKTGICFIGQGKSSKINKTNSGTVIDGYSYSDFSISFIYIYGMGTDSSTGSRRGIYCNKNNSTVGNVSIENCFVGVETSSLVYSSNIYSCHIGLQVVESVSSCTISNCSNYGMFECGSVVGCEVINSNYNISGSRVSSNTSTGGVEGIRVRGGNNVITNNYCSGNSSYGIYILGPSVVNTNNIITGNRCTSNGTNFANAAGGTQTIANNDFT